MSSQPSGGEPRLNPRTRRVRQVILDAAIEVLLGEGPREVTATRVAAHADVARTTVYRHWPDHSSLLLSAIDAVAAPHHAAPNTGPLEDDLRAALENLRTRIVTREARSVFGALAAYAERDEAFADAQRRFVQHLTDPIASVLEAAQERGELVAGLDCCFEATLLAGPILHHYLVLRAQVTDSELDEIARRWLATHGHR